MKQIVFFFSFSILSLYAFSQSYSVTINLMKVIDDRVPVTIEFDDLKIPNVIEFQMPKIVPGTYSISDFGEVISDFNAYDSVGNRLAFSRLDINRWQIKNASNLKKIEYSVNDTFDDKKYKQIFEPGGTNIAVGENFLINTFGFIGYLENKKDFPFKVHVIHESDLYGATPMKREKISNNEDVFSADTYFQLSDSPIM